MNLDSVAEMYSANLERLGPISEAVGWSSDESRLFRYEELNRILDSAGRQKFTLNDFGCGFGGHLEHIISNNYKVERYFGYDLSAPMTDRAEATATRLGVEHEFFSSDSLSTVADFSVVSGTFNVKLDVPSSDWDAYVKQKLIELARHSRRGFAFNVLSTFVDWQDSNLFYANPSVYLEFVQKYISSKVTLLHSSPLYEFTCLVYLKSD